VTSIEPYTFWTCYNLKSITIPSSMNSIAASAFEDCTDLETVYYRGTNWDTLKSSFPSGVTLVTTFTISDIDDQTYDGATYNPDPTVEFGTTLKKDEDYTLSFERKNGSEWEAVTDAIDVGTYRVKVAGVSGTDYADMTEYKEFSITQKSVTITARDDSKNYDGDELTNSSFTYTDLEAGDDHCFTVSMTADSTITDAGTQPNVIATVDGEAVTTGTETSIGNYLITTVNGTLTVDKKNVTVKAQDKEFTYDGNAHSWPEYDVTGLVGTDSIEATVTGSISSASQSPVENVVSSYKFTSGKPENYIVTTENGQLTMKAEEEEAPKIEVEAPDKESTENAVARIFFSGIKVSQKNGNFRISWDKTEGVSKYEVYMTYCGSQYSRKPVATTTNNKVTVKKLNGKKLNLKKNIKIYVAAYDSSGNNVGKTVSSHISGKDRSKYTNPKEIKLTTKALSLTAGETAKIKATVKLENKKKKVSDGHAAQFRYASTNPAIATVDKNGTVTAIASGNCTIYVYAVNGLAKTVTVTVK
ncbi:leucine-rich repeat protein, partial [Butyrivibrio sp. INlla16]|uniref:leucine-rich repeat protein n=1 Tax=Butyrivibrio sp. INlla16 TaxID=1520807 RepID=UPI00147F2260